MLMFLSNLDMGASEVDAGAASVTYYTRRRGAPAKWYPYLTTMIGWLPWS